MRYDLPLGGRIAGVLTIALAVLILARAAPAQMPLPGCTVSSVICNATRDITVSGGFTVPAVCTDARISYDCTDPNPIDDCAALAAAPACTQTARSCIASNYGACDREEVTYLCTNATGSMAPARLVLTEYKNYDQPATGTCQAFQADPACQMVTATCTSGPATQLVNGNPVARPCWIWDQDWQCLTGTTTTTCDVFARDPSCFEADTTCLTPGPGGTCLQEEVRYTCGTSNPRTDPACTAANVCVANRCEGVQPPPNADYAMAAAWLTWLDDQGSDSTLDPTLGPIDIFTGTHRTCRVGAFSVLNCCNDTGWGNGLIGQCTSSEYTLLDANRIGATVHVGTHCSQSLLFCVQWKRSYCAFNSLIAKVFQVEARKQLGIGWGSARAPDCRGLTYAEFQALDFTRIDLSPAFSAMLSGASSPDPAALSAALLAQLQTRITQVHNAYGLP